MVMPAETKSMSDNTKRLHEVSHLLRGSEELDHIALLSEVRCAGEKGTCKCNGMVIFGVGGNYSTKRSYGSIPCSVSRFGDPAHGRVKACYCVKRKVSCGNHRYVTR